jgi:chromosome segregation ATPase
MRWWATLTVVALTVVAAWGEPLSDTEQARQAMRASEQQVASLNAKHGQLDGQLQHENNLIDRLKVEKASWRRDRELRAKLADANDMADQLGALDKQVAAAQAKLATTRTQLVQVIDVERSSSVSCARSSSPSRARRRRS